MTIIIMINFLLIETHLSKPGLVIEIEKVSSIITSQSNLTQSGMVVSIHCAIAALLIQNKKMDAISRDCLKNRGVIHQSLHPNPKLSNVSIHCTTHTETQRGGVTPPIPKPCQATRLSFSPTSHNLLFKLIIALSFCGVRRTIQGVPEKTLL